jgi:hypothetical protein
MISNLLTSNQKTSRKSSNKKVNQNKNKNYIHNVSKATPKIKPLSIEVKKKKKNAHDIMNDLNSIDRLTKNFPSIFNDKTIKTNNKRASKTIENNSNNN